MSGAKFSIAAENLKYAPLQAYLRILTLDRKHGGNALPSWMNIMRGRGSETIKFVNGKKRAKLLANY
jgi:hypothetical protein